MDEVISRMVISMKKSANAGRVGLFLVNDDKKSMTLKVSGAEPRVSGCL